MFNWLLAWWRKDPPIEKDYQKDLIIGFTVNIDRLVKYIHEIPPIHWQSNRAVNIPIRSKYDSAAELLLALNAAIRSTYAGDIMGIKSFGEYVYKDITAFEYFMDHFNHDYHPNRFLDHLSSDLLVLSGNCNTTPGMTRDSVVSFLFPLLEECVMIAALLETLSREQRP